MDVGWKVLGLVGLRKPRCFWKAVKLVKAESDFEIFYFLRCAQFPRSNTMATTLGKRKRRAAEVYKDDQRKECKVSNSPDLDAQEIFRRHFEEAEEDDSEEGSSWNGLSEDEGNGVQVVEHTDAQSRMAAMSKDELKAFMVCLSFSTITLSNTYIELETPSKHSSNTCHPR
jgi:hypothetical protein